MQGAIDACAVAGFRQMIGYIDAENRASIALHERFGFRRVGYLPQVAYKFGKWTDSMMMQRSLGPSATTLPGVWGWRSARSRGRGRKMLKKLQFRNAKPRHVAEIARPLSPFAYWDALEHRNLDAFEAQWLSEFADFRIYHRQDAHVLIAKHFSEEAADLFARIRIPAAASDIGRLMLLHEHGGLYVDCHCGVADASRIRRYSSDLAAWELIAFDRLASVGPKRPDEMIVYNGILFARPKSQIVFDCARQALANCRWLENQQNSGRAVDYDIWWMTGPGLLSAMLLQPGSFGRDIRWDYEGRVRIEAEEDAPVIRGVNRSYAGMGSGAHWSERQKVEPLFAPRTTLR